MSRTKNQQPEIRLLSLLANNKEFEQYKMEKATNLSYPTILKHLKQLEAKKLLKVVRTEPSEKGGKEKKIYAITLKGLWAYLFAVHKKSLKRKDLDQIINRFPDFLVTFKKWPLFEKAKIQDRMMYYFLTSLEITWKSVTGAFETIGDRVEKEITDDYLREWLDDREFVSPVFLQDEKLLEVVKKFLVRWERQQKQIMDIKNWLGDKS
jgi:DNA-binding PadR family transcriptional regulator